MGANGFLNQVPVLKNPSMVEVFIFCLGRFCFALYQVLRVDSE